MGAGKSLGQTVNEYFCAFQFNSLGFQTAIANHAIATLSQQWRAEGSRLIILMPLYPKIVSDAQAVLAQRPEWLVLLEFAPRRPLKDFVMQGSGLSIEPWWLSP